MKTFLAVVAVAGLLAGVGCGHNHSRHDHDEVGYDRSAEKVRDPVCDMMLARSDSKAHEEYKGGHYYFCSHECHSKFEAAPNKYMYMQ